MAYNHENIPQNEKLIVLLDYFVEQWLENQNVPTEMWNTNKHRHRTNNAVEGWNPSLNSITGKQPPSVFLKKQTWYLGSWNQMNLDSLVKTKKDVCKKRRENWKVMEEYDKSNDLYKCLKA